MTDMMISIKCTLNEISIVLFLSITMMLAVILSISIIWTNYLAVGQNTTQLVNVGVVLDTETYLGNIGLNCIDMAISDFYALHSHHYTRLVLNIRDSKSQVITAASAAVDLIKNAQVQAIIGPQDSKQASFVIDLGDKAQVPIISFSTTSPSLTAPRNPYFLRATQNDLAQLGAISAILQAFEWKEAVPIYEGTMYGEELIPHLAKALQEIDVLVPYRSAIPQTATDEQILQELHKLEMMSSRVFIVHMSPTLGSRLFLKASEIGMMSEGFGWIMTTEMSNLLDSMNSSSIESMQGVLGVSAYLPKTKDVEFVQARWQRQMRSQQKNPIIIGSSGFNIFCLWAHDAATALATAVKKAGITNARFQKTSANSRINAVDFEILGVSQSGPELVTELSSTRFKGLSGEISFVNGELKSSTFQIINVVGDGKRTVGFWTPKNGLRRNLFSVKDDETGTHSTSRANLGPIIWPGDSGSAPKGRDLFSCNLKSLRVGVPSKPKDVYNELLDVRHDQATNKTNISGYCIDVFNAVMGALPCKVSYKFIPYKFDYDDLIQQVHLGNFDVAVGDMTISAKRSQLVDFTLPFTETGATFMVRTEEKSEANAWIFLKPLTWQLWLTSFCFFVYIAFVVWVLEHRVNQEFRGSPSRQVGTSFWFSFSTMVFAQRERIHSNLARIVVITWIFVVFILAQSYTASLTTLLTVQQLHPAVTDVRQLLQNGYSVGYQSGSYYTRQILKQIGFDESKLHPYNTSLECDQLLTNGIIAAAFDEFPYINVLQAKYCSKYTTIGPTYRTEGFGFAFGRKSALVPDVSRAILNLREGSHEDVMKAIEDKWFKNETRCLEPSTVNPSYSLDVGSFRGLFLISGIASTSALTVYTAAFLFGQRHRMRRFDPNDSFSKRILVMLKIFYYQQHEDMRLYGFHQNNGQQVPPGDDEADTNKVGGDDDDTVQVAAPSSVTLTHCPSPSNPPPPPEPSPHES